MDKEQEVKEKFYASIEKDSETGCWKWIGFTDKAGLPIIRKYVPPRLIEYSCRRLSLELSGAVLPKTRLHVQLMCGNKLCVNPAHLAIGHAARFWSKVNRTSTCWLWTAGISPDGYGKFTINDGGIRQIIRAHRYAYELVIGPIPDDMVVCHTCDVPLCVRPSHLFIGTPADNCHDRDEKDRSSYGEDHPASVLTEEQVKEIRELRGSKTVKQLSALYGVARSTIQSVIAGKTWRRVK